MEPPQVPSPSPGAESEESPAQRQARLRRERREAKIKAGGSSRLDKITQVSGRPLEPAPPPAAAFPANADEVDPTDPPYGSGSTQSPHDNAGPTEADIRALLRSGAPPPGNESGPDQPGRREDEDPMMRMLQQLMGGLGGQGQEGGEVSLPPGLAAMLGSGGGGGGAGADVPGQDPRAAAAPTATSAYVWRILHALSALLLGVYLTTHATFSSTSRLIDPRSTAPPPSSPALGNTELPDHAPQNMFWIFATTELILQGSRYFLEQGRSQEQAGWLGMLGGMLPEPWKGWLRLAMRYSGIWSTLVEDSMVIVFVLGVVGWWRGLGV